MSTTIPKEELAEVLLRIKRDYVSFQIVSNLSAFDRKYYVLEEIKVLPTVKGDQTILIVSSIHTNHVVILNLDSIEKLILNKLIEFNGELTNEILMDPTQDLIGLQA